jgi:hypothetical protein
MNRTGTACTVSVIGAYWISWKMSFWKITLPGVVAMSRPTSNASRSVWRISRLPLPRSRSLSMFSRPRARFSPFCSNVARSTSGLIAAKLAGDIASMKLRVRNSTFLRSRGSMSSASCTASMIHFEVSR